MLMVPSITEGYQDEAPADTSHNCGKAALQKQQNWSK